MAVYKIFPSQDTTIYSYYPTKNSGLDEILEVSLYNDAVNGGREVSRALIQFPTDEVNNTISKLVNGRSYKSFLKLYLAYATSIPLNYNIYCYPISESWSMGTGRAANQPITTDGASWLYSQNNTTTQSWAVTGSTWINDYVSSQSFDYTSTKDINIDVTQAIHAMFSGFINNNGFVVKNDSALEFNNQAFELKYFSCDTHTIYPPCLEIKWDDFSYSIGSGNVVTTDEIIVSAKLNEEYQQDSVKRIRINVRDKYPARTFQTSSVYLNNKFLPTSSYWAIKDMDSEDFVVNFDDEFTKISADETSNYFDIYMNGLQPERYFRLLIKTVIDGNVSVIDNNNIFKVIR